MIKDARFQDRRRVLRNRSGTIVAILSVLECCGKKNFSTPRDSTCLEYEGAELMVTKALKTCRQQRSNDSKITAGQLNACCPVTEALHRSPHIFMRRVRCELREGLVILHGELASYYQKQMAQEMAMRVPGVELVVNKIEVKTSK